MLLRQFWENSPSALELKNWDILLDDLTKYAKENNIHNENAIGHSIGGNLLLRSAIKLLKCSSNVILSPFLVYICLE